MERRLEGESGLVHVDRRAEHRAQQRAHPGEAGDAAQVVEGAADAVHLRARTALLKLPPCVQAGGGTFQTSLNNPEHALARWWQLTTAVGQPSSSHAHGPRSTGCAHDAKSKCPRSSGSQRRSLS